MSANPEVTPIGKAPALTFNQAMIAGRVASARKTESGNWLTIINTPAPDAYSHPGQHEISSATKIGVPGEDVKVRVQLSGYKRSYKNKEGETVYTVDNRLSSVE